MAFSLCPQFTCSYKSHATLQYAIKSNMQRPFWFSFIRLVQIARSNSSDLIGPEFKAAILLVDKNRMENNLSYTKCLHILTRNNYFFGNKILLDALLEVFLQKSMSMKRCWAQGLFTLRVNGEVLNYRVSNHYSVTDLGTFSLDESTTHWLWDIPFLNIPRNQPTTLTKEWLLGFVTSCRSFHLRVHRLTFAGCCGIGLHAIIRAWDGDSATGARSASRDRRHCRCSPPLAVSFQYIAATISCVIVIFCDCIITILFVQYILLDSFCSFTNTYRRSPIVQTFIVIFITPFAHKVRLLFFSVNILETNSSAATYVVEKSDYSYQPFPNNDVGGKLIYFMVFQEIHPFEV